MRKSLIALVFLLLCLLASPWLTPVKTQGIDHFVFSEIGTQAAGMSFNVTIMAQDSSGKLVTSYNGTPTLMCSAGSTNPSSTIGGFSSGVWTGAILVVTAGSGVTITATDGSHSGVSDRFTVNPIITVTQSAHGFITPQTTAVNYGTTQNFTITPLAGYFIDTVVVDGSSVAVPYTSGMLYSFSNVRESHSIAATFETANTTPPATSEIPTLAPIQTATPSQMSPPLPIPTTSSSQPTPTDQQQATEVPAQIFAMMITAMIATVGLVLFMLKKRR